MRELVQLQVIEQADTEECHTGVYVNGNFADQELEDITRILDFAHAPYKIVRYLHRADSPADFPAELGTIYDELRPNPNPA